MLIYRDVSAGYDTECIVEGVSFQLDAGRILGVIGPNGGGKSTLIRVLYSQADILEGTVELKGRDLAAYTPADRARLIGVLPQSIVAPFAMTAREFAGLGSIDALLGSADEAVEKAIDSALEITNSKYFEDKAITQLSGGELQRLYFAQALVNDPDLLVLDEPTSHLDITHRLQMLDTVKELALTRGKAALIVFHDFDLAARYADELIVVSPRVMASPEHSVENCPAQVSMAQPPPMILTSEMFRSVFGVKAAVDGDKIVFLDRVMK